MPPKKPAAAAQPEKDQQTLPQREQLLFKSIFKLYETKQYKKAIKVADSILEKFPKHGETLAMKGLTLNALGKKDEALKLVKSGLAANMSSAVCWHVHGLLFRSWHQYDDAIKCYMQALRRDPENQQILKDLSLLQIQRRKLEDFTETRRQILLLKPNNQSNWLAYAIGAHLSGDVDKCIEVLDALEKTRGEEKIDPNDNSPEAKEALRIRRFETSEMYLYRVTVLKEAKRYEEALRFLDQQKDKITDRISFRELRASILFELGRLEESAQEWRWLVDFFPDNENYHTEYRRALGLTGNDEGTVEKLKALYEELAAKHPRSSVVRRLPLDFLQGEEFKKRADVYIRNLIRKGIPNAFRDLLPLYKNPAKVKMIQDLVEGYLPPLREKLAFDPDGEPYSEAPSALLYTLFYLGNHYDHLGETAKALAVVDEAIAHTPTALDLYVLKARIYKHAGDHQTAFQYMDFARRMDTQDRYLNTKCTRYAFRALKPKEADAIVALFLREGGESLSSLVDLQVMWYQCTAGECFYKLGDYGRALKRFTAVHKFFEDFIEDQFDFHNYCIRKGTLRAYIDLLRFEDRIQGHRYYCRAAKGLVKTYLTLYDRLNPTIEDDEDEALDENATEEERKKAEKKRKRQQAKAAAAAKAAAEAEAERRAAEEKAAGPKNPRDQPKDDDPNGVQLASTPDPLGMASKYLKNLQLYCKDNIEVHLLAIKVYSRKKKPLLVLRAIKKAFELDPTNPELHVGLCAFLHNVEKTADQLNPVVKQVIDAERQSPALGSGLSARELNESFLSKHKDSFPHRLAAARVRLLLEPKAKRVEACVPLVILQPGDQGVSIQACEDALSFLRDELKEEKAEEALRDAASKRFPYTPAFAAPGQELPNRFDIGPVLCHDDEAPAEGSGSGSKN